MIETVSPLNKKLMRFIETKDVPLGLTDGKMGHCIYFYYLSSIYNDKAYSNIADRLLDEVFEGINTVNSIDVKTGVAGVGLGINYLIKNNYVEGNVNIVLKDIDDVVFKNLSYQKYYEKIASPSLIHLLYYLCIRLKQQKQESENDYLYRELIILTVNNLYEQLPPDFIEEPFTYNIDYILPQLLLVLCEVYKLEFYNYRLIKIIEELSYKILSVFPMLQSNRLYLLWGIQALNKQIKNKNWEGHALLLKNHIVLDNILNHELKNKNIFFSDGVTSIYYLVNSLSNHFDHKEIEIFNNHVYHKIKSSYAWNLLDENAEYFRLHSGLYNGFTGLFLLLDKLKPIDHEIDLTDCTFLILVRIDSIQRLENVLCVTEQLIHHFKINLIVREADCYNNTILESLLKHNISYQFIEDKDPILYKTKYLNQMEAQVETPFIAIWDVDIVVDKNAICDSMEQLRSGKADMVFSYNGTCYDVPEFIKHLYFKKKNIHLLFRHENKMDKLYPYPLVGGAVFVNQTKYSQVGRENESHYGWGNDDFDRYYRFHGSGYKIYRVDTKLFHLSHPRGNDSRFRSQISKQITSKERYVMENSSKKELNNNLNKTGTINI